MTEIRKRAGWAIADQAASSLTNFVMSGLILRSVALGDFGSFTIAYTTYLLALNLSRAIVTEPLLIRYSDADNTTQRAAMPTVSGAALAFGAFSSLLVLGGAWVIGGEVGTALVILAFALPLLLMVDAWRFGFFAAGTPKRALTIDLTWGVLGILGVLLVILSGNEEVPYFIGAWGAAGGLAAVFGILQMRLLPAPLRSLAWLREHRDLSPRLATEILIGRGARNLSLYLVGAIAGLEALGSLNGVRTLLGPVQVVYLGLTPFIISEGVRFRADSNQGIAGRVRILGASLASIAVLAGGLLLVIPDSIGTRILRSNWTSLEDYVIPVTALVAMQGFVLAARSGMRILAAARESLAMQAILAPLVLVAAFVGSQMGGGVGAAWALAGVGVVSAVSWWLTLRRTEQELARTDSG